MAMNPLHKKMLVTKIQQANRWLDSGQQDEARKLAAELTAETVEDEQLTFLLARLFYRLGYFVAAIEFYHKALHATPDKPVLLAGLGGAYTAARQFAEAYTVLSKALDIDSNCVEALLARGNLLLQVKDYKGAIEWLEKAVQLGCNDISAFTNLPLALSLLGRNNEALDYAERAVRRFPKNPKIMYAQASTFMAVGRMKEAERLLSKIILIHPSYGVAYRQFAASKRLSAEDSWIIDQAEAQLRSGMPASARGDFLFALGKMYDDIGDHDKAFSRYQQGNRLVRQLEKPENNAHLLRFQKKLLAAERAGTAHSQGHPSAVPVFVVGMPRSGTSLIEQIVASHPQAAGAGELTEMHQIADALYKQCQKKSLLPFKKFSMPEQATWQQYAEQYLAVLCAGREDSLRITDKLPGNYRFLGMIALMFPQARIVHVIRHPLDVCLSCYFQSFLGLPWSNDLQWIAETYRDYRRIMDDWKKILPEGKIFDIHYEELIIDSQSQSRRLIDACGLDWDPACLEYFNNSRSVQTASVWQVRQPIYQTSSMRWVPYARHLTGLASDLAEFLTEDDFRIFADQGLVVKKNSGLFGVFK